MKTLMYFAVLSLGSLTWASLVFADIRGPADSLLVWNKLVPEALATRDKTDVVSSKAPEADSPHSDKEVAEPDVYWRPWKGKIPKDAFMGALGKTECGSEIPVYMGQVFHRAREPNHRNWHSGFLPAQIVKKSKSVTVSFNRQLYSYKNNIKILCADDPSTLIWLPFNETENLTLTAKEDCVIAGYELSSNIYFGRTNYENEIIIGKVVYDSNTIYFPYYGEEMYLTKNFEILCYKKAIENRRIEAMKKQEEEELDNENTSDVQTTENHKDRLEAMKGEEEGELDNENTTDVQTTENPKDWSQPTVPIVLPSREDSASVRYLQISGTGSNNTRMGVVEPYEEER